MPSCILPMSFGLTSGKTILSGRLPIIRRENADLERQVNKLNSFLVLQQYMKALFGLIMLGCAFQVSAQDRVPFDQGRTYILADVEVTGNLTFNRQTVVTFSGLQKGQELTVPGEIGRASGREGEQLREVA